MREKPDFLLLPDAALPTDGTRASPPSPREAAWNVTEPPDGARLKPSDGARMIPAGTELPDGARFTPSDGVSAIILAARRRVPGSLRFLTFSTNPGDVIELFELPGVMISFPRLWFDGGDW